LTRTRRYIEYSCSNDVEMMIVEGGISRAH